MGMFSRACEHLAVDNLWATTAVQVRHTSSQFSPASESATLSPLGAGRYDCVAELRVETPVPPYLTATVGPCPWEGVRA